MIPIGVTRSILHKKRMRNFDIIIRKSVFLVPRMDHFTISF